MLKRCFVRQETLDRIRSSWLGPAVERYAAWLHDRGYRVKTLAARVSILRQFGRFAQSHGAQGYEELPTHLEPFLQFWTHRPHPRQTSSSSLRVTRHARVAIEQMLRVTVPGFVGRPRRRAIREPFANRAPGFSTYLRDERGLRDTTLELYDEHLRAFAAYLTAVHLLEAGIDVNVIRGWLGHVSFDSTNRYVEITVRAKEAALRLSEPPTHCNGRSRPQPGLAR